MISIITATHNQLSVNQLFVDYLKKYTQNKYELIIIDNHSTDGTRAFFEKNCDILVKHNANYSYPYCQNRGIEVSTFDYIAFLNNDVLVSKNWDVKAIQIMEKNNIEILSFASTDHADTYHNTQKIKKKWRMIKYPIIKILGVNKSSLKLMHYMMYGNWDKFCGKWENKFKNQIITGFSGSCLMVKKTAFDKIGLFDERIQAADWCLFFRSIVRSQTHGDIKPVQLALEIYMHHFQKLTYKSKYAPFIDNDRLILLEEKWGKDFVRINKKLNFN